MTSPSIKILIVVLAFGLIRDGLPQEANPRATQFAEFIAAKRTPLEALVAIALQTHAPMGIVFGKNQNALCENPRAFDIRNELPAEALTKIADLGGYSVTKRNNTLLVVPPDLYLWQVEVLEYRYDSFPAESGMTMAGLGARLYGSMCMSMGRVSGFAASTLHSATSQTFNTVAMSRASTEEIANSIVNLGDKGLWVLKSKVPEPKGVLDEELRIYSYRDDAHALSQLSCDP